MTDVCNVYSAADLNRPESDFGCQEVAKGDPLDSPDLAWCPVGRQVTAGSGLDFVGIYMEITHEYITGLFGTTIEFEDDIVLKVEPQDAT